MEVGCIHEESIVVDVRLTFGFDNFVGSAEYVGTCDRSVVVAREDIMMNIAIHLGHTLVTVSHIAHLFITAPREGNRVVMEVNVGCLAVLVTAVDTASTVPVGDEDIVAYFHFAATGSELECKVDAVSKDAVADDHVAGDPAVGMEDLMLHLRRDSIHHTTGLEFLGRATVLRVGRVGRHVVVLVTEVDKDTVDDEGAFGLCRHDIIEGFVGVDNTLASVRSELLLSRLHAGDVLERVTLGEIAVPTAFEGDEVVDLDVAGVHITEVVTFGNTNNGTVLAVVTDEVENGLDVFLGRCGTFPVRTGTPRSADIIGDAFAFDSGISGFFLRLFFLVLDLFFLVGLLNRTFDTMEVTINAELCLHWHGGQESCHHEEDNGFCFHND